MTAHILFLIDMVVTVFTALPNELDMIELDEFEDIYIMKSDTYISHFS